MRIEPGRVRHRHARPAERPFERAGEIAVAGEPQPTTLGVSDPVARHRCDVGAIRLPAHVSTWAGEAAWEGDGCATAIIGSAGTTGSSGRPVGPIWISVPN